MGAIARAVPRKFNNARYVDLLVETRPRVITDDAGYERMLEVADKLISKERTPEEDELFLLVGSLIEAYEAENYQIPDAKPHEVLQFLMEQRDLKQKDLVEIIGSRGLVSEIVNGKRSISKENAKALAHFFGVSVELFI